MDRRAFVRALKAATSSIPIVAIAHADPVGTGHVASLARPGGNITGVALLQTELGPKGLELLRAVIPAAARIAVLWHPGTPFFFTARQRLAALAIAHRLPALSQGRPYVEAGGLMSYFPNHADVWRHGAIYADKILRGAKPADLPVEQVTKLELLITLKTAKALSLTIPQSVLLRADEVIE
jgi:putative ABC transport system substrate-binding protein